MLWTIYLSVWKLWGSRWETTGFSRTLAKVLPLRKLHFGGQGSSLLCHGAHLIEHSSDPKWGQLNPSLFSGKSSGPGFVIRLGGLREPVSYWGGSVSVQIICVFFCVFVCLYLTSLIQVCLTCLLFYTFLLYASQSHFLCDGLPYKIGNYRGGEITSPS